MPKRHELIALLDIGEAGRKALQLAYEIQPSSYEELIALRGLGPKRIRALALISELIYMVQAQAGKIQQSSALPTEERMERHSR